MSASLYLKHFALDEAPFSITPDPRFVYLTERHRDGLAHLLFGLGQGGSGGFVVLTGEVGTGKTTLCRLALEQLPELTDVALVLNPSLNPQELLETICEELGLDVSAARGSLKQLLDRLNAKLLAAHAEGRRVVLMLDEAQNLSLEALEQVRLLTNLETATQKLLQIILLGQPELAEKLARPELRQLAQRVTARYHLGALSGAETAAYVTHRLSVAGCDRPVFSRAALAVVHRRSGGIPRLINVLADHALLAAFAKNQLQVDVAMINRAAAEVWPTPPMHTRLARLWPAALLIPALLFAFGLGWRMQKTNPAPGENVAVAPEHATQAEPATVDPTQHLHAFLRAHSLPPGERLEANTLACVERVIPGVRCFSGEASAEFFAALQRPVLRQLQGRWQYSSAPTATAGRYLSLYRLPENVPSSFSEGYAGPGVAELAQRLARIDGGPRQQRIYGPRMRARVTTVQRQFSLTADGIVGPETWLVLGD